MIPTAFSIDDISFPPRKGVLDHRSDATIHPFIYSAPMDSVTGYDLAKAITDMNHYAVISRFIDPKEISVCVRDLANHPNIFFAVGFDEAEAIDHRHLAGIPKLNLCLDIAHGHMAKALDTIATLRANPRVNKIMTGSICTPEAAVDNLEVGATHLRIGVGPGSVCITRLMSGCGVPNAYAVEQIHKHLVSIGRRRSARLIADGGISNPGQAIKYMALGADAVMLGSILARAYEAPDWVPTDTGLAKAYRGQASAEFQTEKLGAASHCPEGVSSSITWKGDTVESIVRTFEAGMECGLSYLGQYLSYKLPYANLPYVFLTPSAIKEGQPHGITTSYTI